MCPRLDTKGIATKQGRTPPPPPTPPPHSTPPRRRPAARLRRRMRRMCRRIANHAGAATEEAADGGGRLGEGCVWGEVRPGRASTRQPITAENAERPGTAGSPGGVLPPPPVRPVRAQSEPVSLSSLDDVRLGPAGGGTVSLSSRPHGGRRKKATNPGSVRGHVGGCAGRSDGWAMSSAARPRGGRRRGRRKGATDSGSVRGQSPPAALGAAVHPDPLLTRPSHGWFGSGRQLPPWRVPAGRPGALGPGPGQLRVIAAGLDFSPLRRLSSAGALRGIVWTDPSVRPVMLRHRYR